MNRLSNNFRSHFDWDDLQRLQPGFESSEYVFEKLPATAPGIPPIALPTPVHSHCAEQKFSHDELVLTAYNIPRSSDGEEELKTISAFENVSQERRASATASPISPANLNYSPRVIPHSAPAQQSDEVSTKARYVICKIQEI